MNKKSLYTNVYPKPNLLCWLVNTFVDWREKLLDNHWKQSQKQFFSLALSSDFQRQRS